MSATETPSKPHTQSHSRQVIAATETQPVCTTPGVRMCLPIQWLNGQKCQNLTNTMTPWALTGEWRRQNTRVCVYVSMYVYMYVCTYIYVHDIRNRHKHREREQEMGWKRETNVKHIYANAFSYTERERERDLKWLKILLYSLDNWLRLIIKLLVLGSLFWIYWNNWSGIKREFH